VLKFFRKIIKRAINYSVALLDAQVTNGGFLQFYSNGYRNYVPTINAGLKLIGDNKIKLI